MPDPFLDITTIWVNNNLWKTYMFSYEMPKMLRSKEKKKKLINLTQKESTIEHSKMCDMIRNP